MIDDACSYLESIVATPDDDGSRLAYADWLDAHGDDLGAFIRADFEFAACYTIHPFGKDLAARRDALFEGQRKVWMAALHEIPQLKVRWDRGLAICTLPLDLFLIHHAILTRCRAVLGVEITCHFGDELQALSSILWDEVRPLPRLLGIKILVAFDSWDEFRVIRESPFASRLSHLDLTAYGFAPEEEFAAVLDLACAVELPQMILDTGPELRWLSVVSRAVRRPGGPRELNLSRDPDLCGKSERISGLLRELGRQFAFDGVRTLRLRNLGLRGCEISIILETLAALPAFDRLECLDLGGLPHERGLYSLFQAGDRQSLVGAPNIFPDYLDSGKAGSDWLSPSARAFCGRLKEVTIGVDYDWHGRENIAFLRRLFPVAEIFEDDAYPMKNGETRPLGS